MAKTGLFDIKYDEIMNEKYKNQFKITISYQGHAITVDLRKIVAINHPKANDKYFCVYFDNAIWKVAVSEHDRLYKAWMYFEKTF